MESGVGRIMVKISIIIPIFNNAECIEQCIRSVQSQTISELEIICMDDGSVDQSAEIIRKLQKEDQRIMLYQQENKGAAVARNAGMKKAKGEYLAFLDADDYYLEKDALEQMVLCCEKNRVKACGSKMYLLREGNEKPSASAELVKRMAKEGILTYEKYQLDYDFTTFVFLRSLLVENQITFPEYRYFEDPPFLVRALYAAKEFCMLDIGLYCYRKTDVVFKLTEEKTKDLVQGLIANLNFAKEHNLVQLFEKTLERLEYEYGNYIYHNVSKDSAKMINLLLEAGNIAGEQLKSPEYVVRPLRLILDGAKHSSECYEETLLKKLQETDSVALYGAGKLGRRFLHYLKQNDLDKKVSCFIVSEILESECMLENIPILTLSAYERKQNEIVFVTMGGMNHKTIEENLKKCEILDYILVDDVFLESL